MVEYVEYNPYWKFIKPNNYVFQFAKRYVTYWLQET